MGNIDRHLRKMRALASWWSHQARPQRPKPHEQRLCEPLHLKLDLASGSRHFASTPRKRVSMCKYTLASTGEQTLAVSLSPSKLASSIPSEVTWRDRARLPAEWDLWTRCFCYEQCMTGTTCRLHLRPLGVQVSSFKQFRAKQSNHGMYTCSRPFYIQELQSRSASRPRVAPGAGRDQLFAYSGRSPTRCGAGLQANLPRISGILLQCWKRVDAWYLC